MSQTLANPSDNFSPKEMMQQAERFAMGKVSKSTYSTISLAITAGLFIGLAFVFYITVTTGNQSMNWGVNRLIGGLAFSMGLILVVICGGELFTSTVLSCIARANKQITTSKMLTTWVKVYIGNFLGAMLLLALVTLAGLYQLDGGQWGLNALNIAQHKLHHTPIAAVTLGILCNLLVCLAIWMTFCSNNMLTKMTIMIMPVAMFVSTGFEHSVANMFMVPLGISIASYAPDSFWAQIGVEASQYADLTVGHFITANLIPVTIGNIIGGGVLVGLGYWAIYRPMKLETPKATLLTPDFSKTSINYKDITMHQDNLLINDFMQPAAVILQPSMPISTALDQLNAQALSGAPVLTKDNRIVGFLSIHDVMVDLWCKDFIPDPEMKVQDLMRHEIQTISPKNSILELVEFMCIDKDALYPVSSAGIATQLTSLPLDERARNMMVNRPKLLPVVEGEQLVGMISRQDVIKALRPVFGQLTPVASVAKSKKEMDAEAKTTA